MKKIIVNKKKEKKKKDQVSLFSGGGLLAFISLDISENLRPGGESFTNEVVGG